MNLLLAALTLAGPDIAPATTIWSDRPATAFFESSVLGNGRMGAMVFGAVGRERVILNESTVWSGSPQDADREDAHRYLPKIRASLLAGDNEEANRLTQENFVCKGPGSGGRAYGCYQTLGDLLIESPDASPVEYRRVLDLDEAVTTVDYRANNVHFRREAFTSAPANVLVYRYHADRPGQIQFVAKLARSERATTHVEGNDLVLSGGLDSGFDHRPGVRFQGRLRVVARGGRVRTDAEGIHVAGADEAVIYVTAGTDMFDPQFAVVARDRLDRAARKAFARLRAESVKEHQRFFRRVDLRLPEGPSAHLPTLARLAAIDRGEEDPSLAALYFNFGRYLLIGSSRPDSPLPANLQGIWAEEVHTPWNGDFHLDINLEMNYWPAEVANLSDCVSPLVRLMERLVPNGQKTAKAYYGARGWVVHTITNPWQFTSPGEGAGWGAASTSGAWLCEHLWNHYDYGRDKAYLARIYPTLKGAAEFFLDMLIEEPKHGWLVTAPSTSPENAYIDPRSGHAMSVCLGPTVDMAILRELFGNTAKAAEELGTDAAFAAQLRATRARLAPFQIGKHGQLQEWLEDFDEQDPHHRHLSHLYGLAPSQQITPEHTPEFAKAARVSLERRGDTGLGWSSAWKINLWARLREGERAWALLKILFHPVTDTSIRYDNGGGTYPNMLDACPPFQIDGNFGATAGIAEMLVQSREGEIVLLPALPKSWSQGSVSGLKVRGNLTLAMRWKDGKITQYTLSPHPKGLKVLIP